MRDSTTSRTLTDSDLDAVRAAVRSELEAASVRPPLLKIEGVAALLAVSVRTVENIIEGEELAPIWVGGVRRFDPDAVEAYVRSPSRRKRIGRSKK